MLGVFQCRGYEAIHTFEESSPVRIADGSAYYQHVNTCLWPLWSVRPQTECLLILVVTVSQLTGLFLLLDDNTKSPRNRMKSWDFKPHLSLFILMWWSISIEGFPHSHLYYDLVMVNSNFIANDKSWPFIPLPPWPLTSSSDDQL